MKTVYDSTKYGGAFSHSLTEAPWPQKETIFWWAPPYCPYWIIQVTSLFLIDSQRIRVVSPSLFDKFEKSIQFIFNNKMTRRLGGPKVQLVSVTPHRKQFLFVLYKMFGLVYYFHNDLYFPIPLFSCSSHSSWKSCEWCPEKRKAKFGSFLPVPQTMRIMCNVLVRIYIKTGNGHWIFSTYLILPASLWTRGRLSL
jgi:hypothetical protein